MLTLFLLVSVLFSVVSELNGQVFSCAFCKEYDNLKKYAKNLEAIIAGKHNKKAKDCSTLFKNGYKHDGVYTVYPHDGKGPIKAFCDMTTDGGGWTVIQKRLDGSVNFYRDWKTYKKGFGSLSGEFWLGNDNINRLTNQGSNKLRIDLEDTSGNKRYAVYSAFSVASENLKYKLSIGSYSGNAGDSLKYHHGRYFVTKDRDNGCANQFKAGWWYGACHDANLNGLYHAGPHSSTADGVNWRAFKGVYYSLKKTSMKFRPVDFKSG